MRHLRPQLAILLGAFALAVVLSLVAGTPTFYRNLSLAAHALADSTASGDVSTAAGLTVFDLRAPSFAAEFDCVVRLVAGIPVETLAVTGLGTDSRRMVPIDPSEFRDAIRMVFSARC